MVFVHLISSVAHAQDLSPEDKIWSLQNNGKVDFTLLPTMHAYKQICNDNEASNFGLSGQLREICSIVVHSNLCQDVEKDYLLNCHSINDEVQVDLWEFLKGCTKGVLDSVKGMLEFIWDILKWTWDNSTSIYL